MKGSNYNHKSKLVTKAVSRYVEDVICNKGITFGKYIYKSQAPSFLEFLEFFLIC